jgi:hypothetical protein
MNGQKRATGGTKASQEGSRTFGQVTQCRATGTVGWEHEIKRKKIAQPAAFFSSPASQLLSIALVAAVPQ